MRINILSKEIIHFVNDDCIYYFLTKKANYQADFFFLLGIFFVYPELSKAALGNQYKQKPIQLLFLSFFHWKISVAISFKHPIFNQWIYVLMKARSITFIWNVLGVLNFETNRSSYWSLNTLHTHTHPRARLICRKTRLFKSIRPYKFYLCFVRNIKYRQSDSKLFLLIPHFESFFCSSVRIRVYPAHPFLLCFVFVFSIWHSNKRWERLLMQSIACCHLPSCANLCFFVCVSLSTSFFSSFDVFRSVLVC